MMYHVYAHNIGSFLPFNVIFIVSKCLCIIANTLKTKTKKAVILSLDCLFFSGKRGIIFVLYIIDYHIIFQVIPNVGITIVLLFQFNSQAFILADKLRVAVEGHHVGTGIVFEHGALACY